MSDPIEIETIDGVVTVEKGNVLIDLIVVASGSYFESTGVTLTREQALQVAKALEAAAKEA